MSEKAYIDPNVSRLKFDREIKWYFDQRELYQKRGCWIIEAQFPEVFVVFAANHLHPHVVLFGAVIDFTDYDLLPPSVKMVNPFTKMPYEKRNLPTKLPFIRSVTPQANGLPNVEYGETMQAFAEDSIPFVCLPGIREYHQNSAHTDDHWLIHRTTGEGNLAFILNTLYERGIKTLGYRILLQHNLKVENNE